MKSKQHHKKVLPKSFYLNGQKRFGVLLSDSNVKTAFCIITNSTTNGRSKVRTIWYSAINSTAGNYYSVAFI